MLLLPPLHFRNTHGEPGVWGMWSTLFPNVVCTLPKVRDILKIERLVNYMTTYRRASRQRN